MSPRVRRASLICTPMKIIRNSVNSMRNSVGEISENPVEPIELAPEVLGAKTQEDSDATDKKFEDAASKSTATVDDVEELMAQPGDTKGRIIWCLSLPIYAPLYYCVPKPSGRFIASFLVSLCWIAMFSTVLIYCVELVGKVV